VTTFAGIAERIFSGVTPLSKGDAYIEPPAGIRFLRSGEITVEGAVTAASDVHISEFIHNGMMKRSQLERGDLLIAIVGATIGAAGIYDRDESANINQAIAAVRLRKGDVAREYACWYLHSSLGQKLLDFFKRPVARANINLEEVGEIPLLVPGDTQQREMVSTMEKSQGARRAKLAEADALLAGLDGFLLATLGLTPPPKDDRKVFAVRRGELDRKQIGANLYAPALRVYLRALATGPHPTRPLSEEVAVNPSVTLEGLTDESLVSFVPMEAVEDKAAGGIALRDRQLGEMKKGYTPFGEGDILWAKITPCMENGKSGIACHLTNGVGFGSTEFHVLRPLSERVSAEYVHEFISQATLRRVARYAFTGSAGHQRVPAEFLEQLPLPVPPPAIQETIAAEARRLRDEARRLRAEAEAGWQAAKRWFEEQLLGGGK
jgi:hypothetical protein